MKKQDSPTRSKEEIDQFEDDPFLKRADKKRIQSGSKLKVNWKKAVSNIRANITIYFLVLSIVLIGALIFKFQQTNLLEQTQRVFLNQQKSLSQQNAGRNQLKSKGQNQMGKMFKSQSMKNKQNNNLHLSPIETNKKIYKSQNLVDKTRNFATPAKNKQLPTQKKTTEPNILNINTNQKQQTLKSQNAKKPQIKIPQEKKQENKPLELNQQLVKNNTNINLEKNQFYQKKNEVKPADKNQSRGILVVEEKPKTQQKNGTLKLQQTKQQTNLTEKQVLQTEKSSINITDVNATKGQIQTSNKIKLSQNNQSASYNETKQQGTSKLQSSNQQNGHDIKSINDKQKDDKLRAEKQIQDKQKADKEKSDKEKADKEKSDKEKADKEKADKEKADKEKADKEKADKEKADKEKADKEKAGKEKAKPIQVKTNKPKEPQWPKANLTKEQYTFALRRMEIKNQLINETSPLVDEQRKYFESKYNLSKYTTELPICIVVPSYNNVGENRHFQNMRSILMQEYTNYHIVFIDDASPDKTGQQIQEFMKKQKIVPPERYQIIINKQQRLAMPNLRTAAKEYCKPEQIFIIVDGDDELLGRQVLRLFNAVFQEKKLWFMYTNYLPKDGYVGYSQEIPADIIRDNKYRDYKYCTSHLRAYYTQLFRNIKDADLQDSEGKFLRAANDVAIIFPIMEQAQDRVGYVPQYMYYYNDNTGINNRLIRKPEQLGNEKMLRKRNRYKRLDNLMSPIE